MIFNDLGDMLYMVQALESINTAICITNENQQVIYESTRRDYKHNTKIDDIEKIIESLQHSRSSSFKIKIIDCYITAITTVPFLVDNQKYFLEFRQFISRIWKYHTETCDLENLSIHQIKEMAITDSLTKLYNRRYIDERLPIDMQSAFELDKPISVLFIDIDYFKRINDSYGHAAGDQILQQTALIIQRHFKRDSAWVARYGGDEILICLPGHTKRSAKRIAGNIRKTIESNIFLINDYEINITCSIGVQTAIRSLGINSLSELLELADKNLYLAKNKGRNKVV